MKINRSSGNVEDHPFAKKLAAWVSQKMMKDYPMGFELVYSVSS